MLISQIETPALVVDLDILESNHKKMLQILEPLNMALRPHYKSHKCTALARLQVQNGAKGICCAKLSEAEDLILCGIEDVLIANQVTDPQKIARLAQLAACCHLSVCVDSLENIRQLDAACTAWGSTLHCLVEYDVGMKRCGVSTEEEVLTLSKAIMEAEHLSFMGIQAYAGNLAHEYDHEKRQEESLLVEEKVGKLLAFLRMEGIWAPEVSGCSTGTVEMRPKPTVYTEAQAGSYLFMDAAYNRVGAGFGNSLFMLTSVISASDDRVVCDAGVKSLGTDQGNPVFELFPEAQVEMSEEHCAAYCAHACKVGDKLRLIPGHCCTTVNLHDWLYLIRGGKVVDRIPVTSRGKCR